MKPTWTDRAYALMEWLKTFRYIKFGLVGASGTVVNLVMLHLGHEYIFNAIEAAGKKPYASLALAITIATVNNFTWNRLWTWSDRVKADAQSAQKVTGADGSSARPHLVREFGKYAAASGFGSALQYGLTLLLSGTIDYRIANVIAILIASVSNYLANDKWTFKRH
jgi:dolichol-phosphate mannosyltransferase